MHLRAILLAALGVLLLGLPGRASAQSAGENRALPPATYDVIQERLGGAPNLQVYAPDTLRPGVLGAASFTYGADGKRYGGGVAVWNLNTGALLWELHEDTDYPVHISHWIDFNGDGRPDFVSQVGEEDYFSTTLYLNHLQTTTQYDSAAFIEAFRSNEAYSTFLDLNQDGIPEILTPGEPSDSGLQDVDGPCQSLKIPPSLSAAAMKEYRHLAGPLAEVNFTYGFSDFAPLTLHMLSPVRIYQIQGLMAHEVTEAFPAHLRWRLAWLRDLLPRAPRSCIEPIRRLMAYLASASKGQ